jgi:hypothetical protein
MEIIKNPTTQFQRDLNEFNLKWRQTEKTYFNSARLIQLMY